MNKQELEHKLEQARKDRELATAEANKEVDRLKKLLAEAKKPTLRKGDVVEWVGQNCSNVGINVMYNNLGGDRLKQCNITDGVEGATGVSPSDKFIKHFNILEHVADLKAIEPLDSFEVRDGGDELRVRLCAEGQIEFKIADMTATMDNIKTVHEIILKLRGLRLKLKQDKEKS